MIRIGRSSLVPVTYRSTLVTGVAVSDHNLKIFAGNAHPALAQEIAKCLGTKVGEAEIGSFPDGEVRVQILENVRGTDVFVVQPTCRPVNDNLVELLIMLDAFRRASADKARPKAAGTHTASTTRGCSRSLRNTICP